LNKNSKILKLYSIKSSYQLKSFENCWKLISTYSDQFSEIENNSIYNEKIVSLIEISEYALASKNLSSNMPLFNYYKGN
jgi:hypothetical protein